MPSTPLGSRIRAVRKAAGLTQQQLAQATGLAQTAISKLEQNKQPTMDALAAIRLARRCDCSVEWLMTGTGSPTRPQELHPDETKLLEMFRLLPENLRSAIMERCMVYAETLGVKVGLIAAKPTRP